MDSSDPSPPMVAGAPPVKDYFYPYPTAYGVGPTIATPGGGNSSPFHYEETYRHVFGHNNHVTGREAISEKRQS